MQLKPKPSLMSETRPKRKSCLVEFEFLMTTVKVYFRFLLIIPELSLFLFFT